MFRWALNVVLLLLSVAFGSMLTLHGETYSLFYLLGVKDHTAQVVCCFLTGWLFFAWLMTLWICRAKIYKDVLTAEKQDKFFPASEKAKKCYRQNKALFWRLRLYLAFAEKEKEFLVSTNIFLRFNYNHCPIYCINICLLLQSQPYAIAK